MLNSDADSQAEDCLYSERLYKFSEAADLLIPLLSASIGGPALITEGVRTSSTPLIVIGAVLSTVAYGVWALMINEYLCGRECQQANQPSEAGPSSPAARHTPSSFV